VSPLRVEFHLPAEPTEPPTGASAGRPPPPPPPEPAVATVAWRDGRVTVEADDPELATGLERAFRRTPVVVDDASLRPAGALGASVLQPGDLEWFRGVALVRVPAELGLVPRFVPGRQTGGYDPAANYRRFGEQVERLDARSGA
jgi:hypothetical protein